MGFVDAIKSVFSQYVGFSGRAMRSEYWYWVLFSVLVSIITSILDAILVGFDGASPLNSIVNLVLLLPGLAVSVRRLHDIGRSGWWLLLGVVPLIGWLVLIIWAATKGDATENRFGPPPLPPIALSATA
ncbi:uncharacterized membrane protein YhaH (DUF805 family) [Azospirillum lipoferum]|uniref:DUF805 domain-containing protein n=1 Tax=Azospirillum lipoferum TaxID=193 RepID=A0A5A9GUV4_AZOLI|nr:MULTISPECIES: DUF805 domain-containing protein [Azospirillum]KAA0597179.1 DUF805 domain-containing protein [Azospirillum lipoferum]MCP1608679.1 uncharacterized membrane protein YhaH (DUF805 family) [Azospirillum lipoferum]MDW5536003.1 DUF805 domain-containing protein [Azospirillum sp. NL1]